MNANEFIEVEKGVRLHVCDWGRGKPILFIHGWPLSLEMFEYQFTKLPEKGFRCIGITLRGFGHSDKPWGVCTYDTFADDVKKVLEALSLKDVTLLGFSMGGAIALRYIERHRGERIAKLVLCGAAAPRFTKADFFSHGLEKSAVDALIEQSNNDRARLNADFGKIFFSREDAVSLPLGVWFQNMGMAASPHATVASLVALRDTDLRSAVAQIHMPTLILHGVKDKICPFILAEVTAQGIQGSKLVRFENSGHGLFYEEKDKFNKELIDFVK